MQKYQKKVLGAVSGLLAVSMLLTGFVGYKQESQGRTGVARVKPAVQRKVATKSKKHHVVSKEFFNWLKTKNENQVAANERVTLPKETEPPVTRSAPRKATPPVVINKNTAATPKVQTPAPAPAPAPVAAPVVNAPTPKYNLSASDMDMLDRIVQAEAGGEPYEGQVAVAAVILNRLKSPTWPKTIHDIIFQKWQFESVDNGWFFKPAGLTASRAARDAVNGIDPTRGAQYFWNANTSNPFLWSKPYIKIGNQYFA